MGQSILVTEEINAGEKLVREFNRYMSVLTAFWLKASDEDYQYLYIAPSQLNELNFKDAYEHVLELADKFRSPFLDPFRVKLIKSDSQLSKAALDIQNRFPARIPTRFGGSTFGDVSVDEVYIYPPLPHAVSN